MTRTFELGAPDDLVRPRAGSMTARALVSFAQRSLFEMRASLRAPGLVGTVEDDAIALWLDVVAGMLPGKPHAVAASLRDPAVFVPARVLLEDDARAREAARAFVGSALLWLEREGALEAPVTLPFETTAVALGHGLRARAGVTTFGLDTACTRLRSIEGRLVAVDEGPFRELGLAEVHATHDDDTILALRAALAKLPRAARDDLDRVAVGFVRGRRLVFDVPLGLVFVPERQGPEALVRTIVAELVTEKLALVRLGDTITSAYEPLRMLCVDVACGATPVEALAVRLEALRDTVTPIGLGVIAELERGLRTDP